MKNKIEPIKIGEKSVGPGERCFIIAEAGVNHNGDLNRARELVDLAAEAGADVVKFQTFFAENIVTRSADRAKYQKENMPGVDETQWQMLKKLELGKDDFSTLKEYSESKGIMFMSTPYDNDSIDLLTDIGVQAFKVSSAWITHLPFLEHMAKKGLPIIFSRGMSYEDEIQEAIDTIKTAGNDQMILLHCHFNYPTDIKNINLKVMKSLQDRFNIPVGFSDHTQGINASIAAVAMGASVIEKHFTLDKNLPGPDHKASLEPKEFINMIKGIREVEDAMGSTKINVTPNEAPMREVSRTSIVSGSNPIRKGTVITEKMLTIKRPGTGIKPRHWKDVVGQVAAQNIEPDTVLSPQMIAGLDKKLILIGNKVKQG